MSVVSCESSAGNNVFPPPEVLLGAWAGSAALAYCRDRQGSFIAANPSFARKFGCNPGELIGRPVTTYLHQDDLSALPFPETVPPARNKHLVKSDYSVTSQIAEIIRRDPSLSARLLRMVNSVYFSLSARVNNIEEAVFFLGLRQIRELSMATPVIEELERLKAATATPLPWKELWSHSIASAMLTREILQTTSLSIDDDTDYLVGLLHNIGKVVMANVCPKELETIARARHKTIADVCAQEQKLVGWDHAQIGAYYLERHQLPEEIVFAVKYHNNPAEAPRHQVFAAAAQVADQLVRHSGITGGFEKIDAITAESWLKTDGWKILFGENPDDWAIPRSQIGHAMNRLPAMLSGLT